MEEVFVSLENKVFVLKYEYKVEDNTINMKLSHNIGDFSYNIKLQFPTYLKNRTKCEVKNDNNECFNYEIKISESKNHLDEVRDIIHIIKNCIINNHKSEIDKTEKIKYDKKKKSQERCESEFAGFTMGASIMFAIMLVIIKLFFVRG